MLPPASLSVERREGAVRLIALVVAAVCASGIAVVHAQDPAKSDVSPQTFRTATRLIQVSVVVHDRSRKAVEGLRTEDFELFEDGRQLPVSLFAVQQTSATDAAAAASGVFSNRLQSPSNGGVVAMVYDQLNTSASDQMQARKHILEYLGHVRPEDRVALYVLASTGMYVLHDFTRDTKSLLGVLGRTAPLTSVELSGSEEKLPAGDVEGITAFEAVREADVTLPFSLTDEMRNQLAKDGLRITRTIELRDDAHQVRVVARDVHSGVTGSVIMTAAQFGKPDSTAFLNGTNDEE
jgi:VWFA-related protein